MIRWIFYPELRKCIQALIFKLFCASYSHFAYFYLLVVYYILIRYLEKVCFESQIQCMRIGQYFTIFVFQYCEPLVNTGTSKRSHFWAILVHQKWSSIHQFIPLLGPDEVYPFQIFEQIQYNRECCMLVVS